MVDEKENQPQKEEQKEEPVVSTTEATPVAKPKAKPKAEAPKKDAKPAAEPKAEAPKKDAKPAAKPKAEAPKKDAKPAAKPKAEAPKKDAKPAAKPKADAKPKAEPKAESKKATKTKDDSASPDATSAPEAAVGHEVEAAQKKKMSAADKILAKHPLFGKWDLSEVKVEDPGLVRYINLDPLLVPHTGAKHTSRAFGKTRMNIVERLINNLMRTEHTTGKKIKTYKCVQEAFEIINKRAKENPVQVLVKALENSSPKEEITRLRFGGISVPKAVDTSASRKLDIALRNICVGITKSSHKNRKSLSMCVANELLLASRGDMDSYAVSKKEELERVAQSAR